MGLWPANTAAGENALLKTRNCRFFLALALLSCLVSAGAQSKNSPACEQISTRGSSSLSRCGKIHILRLEGTPLERARAHGEFIREGKISAEVFTYFSERVFRPLGPIPAPLHWLAEKTYGLWVNRLHRPVSPEIRAELAALAEGMGVKTNAVERAIVLPDTSAFLNGLLAQEWTKYLPALGCTSIAKRYTDSSGAVNFAYGRNLDFASVGLWDQNPQISIQIPPPGSAEIPHIAFGAPGVQFGGITGVNAAGITFAVHQNYSRSQRSGGWPMFLVGEMVLRSARSIEEAIAIIRKYRPSPLWTFVVTDLKRGDAAAIEVSQQSFAVRHMLDPEQNKPAAQAEFAQTNHLLNAETAPFEFIQNGHLKNSEERLLLALSQLQNWPAGTSALPKLQSILSFTKNAQGELNAHADIIKAHTIQTVLFSAQKNSIQVALSQDAAPVSSGSFLQFSLSSLLQTAPSTWRFQTIPANKIPAVRANQAHFAKAFVAAFDDRDYERALSEISLQNSANAILARAVYLARLDRIESAYALVEQGLEKPGNALPHLVASLYFAKMLLGQYLESQPAGHAQPGMSSVALAEIVLQKSDNPWQKQIAAKVLRGEKLSGREKKLGFDFFSGDLVSQPHTP